jgi:protease IV
VESRPGNQLATLTLVSAQRKRRAWLVVVLCCLGLVACKGRPQRAGTSAKTKGKAQRNAPHLAILDLRYGVPERPPDGLFESGGEKSFAHLVVANERLRAEPMAKAVFVRLGYVALPLERAAEIGSLLAKHRRGSRGGGGVVCHAQMLSNATLGLAARGCDEIWLSAAGGVDSVGIAAQLIFGKALFDRLQADVDFLQVGKFKGASEPFTRESSSPEARQSLQTTLSQLRAAWLDGLRSDRATQKVQAEHLEDGPYSAEVAKARGLVDRIGFEDEALAAASKRAGTEAQQEYFGPSDAGGGALSNFLRQLASGSQMSLPHVAIVQATGAIRMGGSGNLGTGEGITRDKLSATLRKLRRDPAVRSVVLRMDSPGGSALASDLLWHAVRKLRKKKPVVVSVGGMAASGGYYIASAANHIVAHPLSIVGSIGVVAGKVSFRRSLARIGVNIETVTARPDGNPRALYTSPLAGWDDATRTRLRVGIQEAYRLFLERISKGRNTTPEALAPAAEGRIMAGKRAHELALVDSLGTLSDAIAKARSLAQLPPKTPVRVVLPRPGILNLIASDDDDSQASSQRKSQQLVQRTLQAAFLGHGLFQPHGPLAMYRTQIYDFVSSMAPLVEGERVAAALPFILVVR